MKPSEAVELVQVLAAAFPQRPLSPATLRVYVEELCDLDYDAAVAAARTLIRTVEWLPTVAQIRAAVVALTSALPSPDEALLEVRREIGRVGSYGTPRFSSPVIERVVRAIGWDTWCASENPGIERAHFIRLYTEARTRATHDQAVGALPAPGLPLQLVGDLATKLTRKP